MYVTSEFPSRSYQLGVWRYKGDVRFPDTGLQCVVYIGEMTDAGFKLRGTGFLVQVERLGGPIYYLVTAHHVIRDMKEPTKFAIRLNRQDGTVGLIQSGGFFRWWRHPDDRSVDAAVYPWGVRGARYKLFPASRFLTQDVANERMIGIGDEVYIVGLFRKWAGNAKITPTVRTGHIAMMANERMPLGKYGNAFMHLIEAFSLAGFSGSPVFVHETISIEMPESPDPHDSPYLCGVGNIYPLGLLHGHLPVRVAEELTGTKDKGQMWPTGLSLVVPADRILDILNQPKLLEYEQEMLKKLDETNPVEASLRDDDAPVESERRNRDIPIPPISREKFFGALKKTTRKRKSSS